MRNYDIRGIIAAPDAMLGQQVLFQINTILTPLVNPVAVFLEFRLVLRRPWQRQNGSASSKSYG